MVAVDQAANIGIQFQGKRQSGPRFHHLVDTDEAHAGRYDRRKAGDADGGRHVRQHVKQLGGHRGGDSHRKRFLAYDDVLYDWLYSLH
jgi:hypothetical protein